MKQLAVSLLALCLLLLPSCSSSGGGGEPRTAGLSILDLSGATLFPAFSSETFFYTAAVPAVTDAVLLTANTADTGASVMVDGGAAGVGTIAEALALAEGVNVIRVVVAAADGSSSRTYTIEVTRAPAPTLSSLDVSLGALSPPFDPSVTSYSVSGPFLETQTTVTAATAGSGAMITFDGAMLVSGQESDPVSLAEGANTLQVRVQDATGAQRDYTVTVDRATADEFVERALLRASNATAELEFGSCIALDGDTLAVGAWQEDTGGQNSGAVYVFTRNGGTWSEQAFLKASAVIEFAEFGRAVALDGDTLVVGELNTNQARVFTRSGGIWTERAVLSGAGLAPYRYGFAVAISGDTIAVSSPYDDEIFGPDYLESAGSVYVYTGSGASWTQTARLTASNPGEEDLFGYDIALDGDTLVVGAPFEDSSSTGVGSAANDSGDDNGAAYVFTRSGPNWSQQAYLKPSQSSVTDLFGVSVDVSGDRVAVGAPLVDDIGFDNGRAYVFERNGGAWNQTVELAGDNTGVDDTFGWSVALEGSTLVVGAKQEASAATGTNPTPNDNGDLVGAVYVFMLEGATWSQRVFAKASNSENGDVFGTAVAISGETVASSAPFEDGSANDGGAVYVLR